MQKTMTSIDKSQQDRIQTTFRDAFQSHQAGELDVANALYGQILALDPHHFDALHLSGLIAVQMGDPQLGLDLMQRALEKNPNDAAAHKNYGIALHNLDRFDEALKSYALALEINPQDFEALYNAGNAYLCQSRFEEAVNAYETAIKFAPNHINAHLNLGTALHELGYYQLAIASYDLAIALEPGFAQAFFNRGLAFEGLNEPNSALIDFERALIFDASHQDAQIHLTALQHKMGL